MKTIILIFLSTIFLTAQNRIVLNQNGEIQPLSKHKTSRLLNKAPEQIKPFNQLCGVCGVLDTLHYGDAWTINFGFFGQDIMLQWFEAPADMDITGIGFEISDYSGRNLEVKLVDMVWSKDQVQATHNEFGASHWGYYQAEGNGYNDATAFLDNPDRTGGWVEAEGQAQEKQWGSPFGNDIWSDNGTGFSIETNPDDGTDMYWVDMDELGFRPQILAWDIFGVAIKNQATMVDTFRAGLAANNSIGVTGFKYYANGRFTPAVDYGWWTRLYTWNVAVAVDLPDGPRCIINNYTYLYTTLSTEPRLVEAHFVDDNPSGDPKEEINLHYTIDAGTNWTVIKMEDLGEGNFQAYIPGQPPGTEVSYYLEGIVDSVSCTTTNIWTYRIFQATQPVLLVYDDNSFGLGTISAFWMKDLPPDSNWQNWGYDIWEAPNGPVSLELLTKYQQVYHLMGVGPVNQPADPGSVYKAWLDQASAENPRNLFLSGQDYGYISGFEDTTFPAGSFEYDYLGVQKLGPQDINYVLNQDQNLPYAVDYVEADPLSGWLADFENDTSFLTYNPTGPLGFANWIDNLTPSTGTAIFTDPNTEGGIVAARNQGANWKTTFWTMDPLGLDYIANTDSTRTFWVSGNYNPAGPVFQWFGEPVTSVENRNQIPTEFSLRQNYPNPFNALTTIEYSVAANIHSPVQVTLKIYDTLGRLLETVVDKKEPAGQYKVTFDATELSSGVYYYILKADNFTQTRKMVLLK